MIIVNDIEQGSEEWNAARCGIPSASVFDKIVTGTGKISTQRDKLIFTLAGERLLGRKEEGYTNSNMQRGIELEAEARDLFQLLTGLDVEEVGLVYKDEERNVCCSPDGIIGSKEGLEIKCPTLGVHTEYLLNKKLPSAYFQQVQGSLYLTGFNKWHFFSYYPDMPHVHVIVERNEEWISAFSGVMKTFLEDLDATHKLLLEGQEWTSKRN